MIKVSLIVLLGLAATVLLRKRSAEVRHWVLAAAIVCAGVTPVLQMLVPVWHLPVSSSIFGRRVEPLALFIPVHERQLADPSDAVQETRFVPVQPSRALRLVRPIWLAGMAISLSFLLVGFARLAWLASRSQQVSNETWTGIATTLSRRFGLRRPVLLLQSDHPTLLVTWGLHQPKVILPDAARGWHEDRVQIVLAHELAHIRRGDWLVLMAAELLRAVYWFNPLIWIACRRLRRESEHACDDAVLGLGVEGTEYASHLLDLARAFRQHHAFFPAPAMARPSSLERRVSAMLNRSLNRTPLTRSSSIVVVIALLTIALPIAGLVASAQATASFSGSLVDTIGRILPDTPMVLSEAQSHQKHQARSDQNGHFSFAGLTGGDYVLEVDRAGFETTQGRVRLGAGQSLMQDVALQLGTLQETIMITDAAPAAVGAGRQWIFPSKPDPVCSQTTVGGCIEQPSKIHDVKPQYPAQLTGTGRGATVLLEARIGVDGFINDLRVVSPGEPEFAAAAVEGVRGWAFSQTRLDGVPVEVRMKVSVTFRGIQ
jgi:TonB family protein